MLCRLRLIAIPTFAAAALLVGSAATVAQDVVDMDAPITVDDATFDHYFGAAGDAELRESFRRNAAEIELKLREIAADKTVTADQLDRIRMAAYTEKMAEPRRQMESRRLIVGKSFPTMHAVFATYHSQPGGHLAIFGGQAKSMMLIVYDRVLTPEQKRNHQTYRAERRGRLARAAVLVRVSQMGEQVAMLPAQQIALAKLTAKEMPPARLYDDEYLDTVIGYSMALIPSEELAEVFEPNQLTLIKQQLGDGSAYRDQLRSGNTLERITAYRAAAEKAARDAEATADQQH
jgi:hypothetical protein